MSIPAPTQKKWMTWTGRVVAALITLLLVFSAYMKLSQNPQAVQGFAQAGYPAGVLVTIGVVELACVLLFLIPRTSVLGAILLTGYLGGAVAHHVRASEDFLTPLLVGVFAWGTLFLRDVRLRELLPFVAKSSRA